MNHEPLTNMSGHSKWSKVKHQKATTDVVKAAAFTKASRGISLAVREGGGIKDPDMNFKLRLAIEKAKQVNMPKENIARAIDKGAGTGGRDIAQIQYEALGPGAAALIIETVTDNKQRTVSSIKNILSHHGGVLTSPGAVSYMFLQSGLLILPKVRSIDEVMAIALEAGADDVREYDSGYEMYSQPQLLSHIKSVIEKSGLIVESAQIIMKPIQTIHLIPDHRNKLHILVEQLEEADDIQNVYTNASRGVIRLL